MPFGNDPVVGGGGGFGKDPLANAPATTTQPQHGALYNALFQEATPGSGNLLRSADEGILPAARDYSLAALDDLTLGLGVPSALKAATSRAQQNLGPMSYVTGAATYGLGPGKVLGPAGRAIGAYAPVAKPLAGMAAEGALAGGVSGLSQGTGNPLYDATAGALGGAALGGAAGGVGMGVGALGKGAVKLAGIGAPKGVPDVDLGPITSQLGAARDAAYAPGHGIQFDPNTVLSAYRQGVDNLDIDQQANLSPGFKFVLNQHDNLINGAATISASNLDGFARGLDEAAANGSNADRALAGKITVNLEGKNGVMGSAQPISNHAPGDAAAWQSQAKAAHAAYQSAQGLQEAAQAVADAGQDPAAWAMKQIQDYYPSADPTAPYAAKRQALLDIVNSGGGYQTAWNIAHAGAPIAEGLGGLVGGWPGEMIAGTAYHLGAKPAIAKAMSAGQKAAYQQAIHRAYPILTGITPPQPPTSAATTALTSITPTTVGEGLKNLMLGTAY